MRGMAGTMAGAALLAGGTALAPAEPYVATAPDAGRQLHAMVALYDTACLRAFPDDAAVARLMRARGAVRLDADAVRDKLHDDPGVGWALTEAGARFTIVVEAPPYHACAVRTMTAAGFADLAPYQSLRDGYRPERGPWSPVRPLDQVDQGVHTILHAEGRELGVDRFEMLIVASGEVADEAARRAGQAAIEIRFVHQIVDRARTRPAGPAT